jgi:hypothetical protein
MKTKRGKGIHSHLKAGVSTLITGRNDYSPFIKKFLNEYGNHQITRMYIEREPLPELFTTLADYLTSNKFSQNKKDYDDLYHLRAVATLDNGINVVIEKNHSVNVGLYDGNIARGTQQLELSGNFPTLQELVDNTRDIMGITKFNKYTVSGLNCQNFILNLLRANGLNNEINEKFSIQDVKSIFNDIEYLNNMVDVLTNIAYSSDVIMQGGAISEYLPSKNTLYKTAATIATAYLARQAFKNITQKDANEPKYTPDRIREKPKIISKPISTPVADYDMKPYKFEPIPKQTFPKDLDLSPFDKMQHKSYNPYDKYIDPNQKILDRERLLYHLYHD